LKKMKGNGAISKVSPAKSAMAPTLPSRLNMGRAMRGNATHSMERRKALEAIADAECSRYVDTIKVKTELKHKIIPVPKGADPMMGTTQCTLG